MFKTMLLLAAIALTGCTINERHMYDSLFDKNSWKAINTNEEIKKDIFYEK